MAAAADPPSAAAALEGAEPPSGHEQQQQHQEEGEEPVCRVCHMEAEPAGGRPLCRPCKCRGSISSVHQDCLLQWLEASRNAQKCCELCGATFLFRNVYAPNAPAQLSVLEIVEGLARKLLRLAPDVGRHVLAYVLWLLLLPLLTSLLFQAYALPSLADAPVLLFNRCLPLLPPVPKQHARPAGGQDGLPFVLASTIGGWVLCGAIGAMSLAGLGLRDAVLQQARALFESDEEEEQEGEQDAGAAVEGAAAVPPPPQPVAQAFGGGMGLDAPVEEWIPLDFREAVGLQGPLTAAFRRWLGMLLYHALFLTLFQLVPTRLGRLAWALMLRADAAGGRLLFPSYGQGSSGSSSSSSSSGSYVWGHLTRAIRALRDMEAEAQRAVTAGPRGGPSVAGALLAQVEALVTWMGGEVPGPAAGAEAEGAAGDGGEGAGRRPGRLASIFWGLLVKEQLGKGTQPPRHNADRRTGFAAELKREVVEGLWRKQNTTAASASPAAVAANAVQGAAALVEQLAVLALGVSVLLGLLASVALAYVVASAIRDPRRARRMLRRAGRGLERLLGWGKVALLFVVDLLVIPQVLGWLLDACTTEVFSTTLPQRLRFLADWPLASLAAHWLAGCAFMALAALLVTELRRVLHPDVLRGLLPQPGEWDGAGADGDGDLPMGLRHHDPAQQEDPADRTLAEHFRKILLAYLIIYVPLLVLFVRIPVRFGHLLVGRLLGLGPLSPLRLRFFPSTASGGHDAVPLPLLVGGEGQLIVELFLFHVALPVLLERFRLRDLVRFVLEHIFAPLCRALSLGGLLDEETLAAVRDRRRRQQAQRRERLRRGGVAGPPLPPLAPVHIRPEPPQPQQEGRSHGADDEREGEEEEEEEGKQGGGPLAAVVGALRLVALLVLSGAGAVLAASVAAQLPVRLGRWLLRRWLGLGVEHDLYALTVGCLPLPFLLAAAQALSTLLDRLHAPPPHVLRIPPPPPPPPPHQPPPQEQEQREDGAVQPPAPIAVAAAPAAAALAAAAAGAGPPPRHARFGRLLRRAAEAAVLLALWLGAAPLLLGGLFELAVGIPARVPVEATPVLPMFEAWALGLVLLKLWVRCCLLGVFGPDDPWKRKLERVRARGFRGLQFFDTLKEVVWPVCIALSTAIITPYLLSATVEAVVISYLVALDLRAPPPPRGGPLAPLLDLLNGPYRRHRQGNATVLLGMRRHEVLRGVARLKQSAHLAFILLRLLLAGLRWLRRAAKRLHDTLRDERYLVGVELQDRATTPVEAVRVLPRR